MITFYTLHLDCHRSGVIPKTKYQQQPEQQHQNYKTTIIVELIISKMA